MDHRRDWDWDNLTSDQFHDLMTYGHSRSTICPDEKIYMSLFDDLRGDEPRGALVKIAQHWRLTGKERECVLAIEPDTLVWIADNLPGGYPPLQRLEKHRPHGHDGPTVLELITSGDLKSAIEAVQQALGSVEPSPLIPSKR